MNKNVQFMVINLKEGKSKGSISCIEMPASVLLKL